MDLEILDAISALEEINDLEAAKAFIEKKVREFGFTTVACLKIAGPGEEYVNNLYVNTRPEEWSRRYLEENHPLRDPVVQELRRSSSSFAWKDVLDRPPLPGSDPEILLGARDFDMKDGFVVPVFLQNGYAALVSYTTDYMDIPPRTRRIANLFGLYAHSKLRALQLPVRKNDPLSPREREVMLWVAAGKTDDEIGDIIGLSHNTVHKYIENAKIKLDASTRTYAVVQALRLGEINL